MLGHSTTRRLSRKNETCGQTPNDLTAINGRKPLLLHVIREIRIPGYRISGIQIHSGLAFRIAATLLAGILHSLLKGYIFCTERSYITVPSGAVGIDPGKAQEEKH
jgi:hypothetical protein